MTTSSPENNAPATPEHSSAEVEALIGSLDLETIANLRNEQAKAYIDTELHAVQEGKSIEDARILGDEASSAVNDYFLEQTLQSDIAKDNATEVETLIKSYSGTKMTDDEWYNSQYDADGNVTRQSGIERFQQDIASLRETLSPSDSEQAHDTVITGTENDLDLDDDLLVPNRLRGQAGIDETEDLLDREADLKREVDYYRHKIAKLTAKRQARIGGDGGKKYEAALATYNQKVVELGRIQHKHALEGEYLSEEEKRVLVTEYLFEQQAKLRDDTLTELKGGKVYKFVEWMNRGGKWARVGKGLLVGAGVGVVGAGLGALGGIAGAAGLGAALTVGAVSAGRFARGYARADAIHHQGMKRYGDADKDRAKKVGETADEDHFNTMTAYFTRQMEADTKKEQSKQRKKVAWGAGAIAVGGVLSTVAFVAVDAVGADGFSNRNLFDKFENKVIEAQPYEPNTADHRMFDITSDSPETSPESVEVGNADGSTTYPESTVEVGNADGSTTNPETAAPDGSTDTDTDTGSETDMESSSESFSGPHFEVGLAQGGIEVFQNAGLSEEQWYSIAPDLYDNFKDTFYMEGEDVRIRTVGPLPDDVQAYINTRFGL